MVKRVILILLTLSSLSAFELNAQRSEEARQLFRETKKRADKGDAQSQYEVAGFYSSGVGVTASPKKAFKYYAKAAEQGLADAQYQLGLDYAFGQGVKEDLEEAAFWIGKAAEQGLVEAELEIGRRHLAGKGVAANGVEAMKWFRRAAAQGSVAAQYYIGKCYLEGTGVSRDIQAAAQWTRQAAEGGNPLAQEAFGGFCEKGIGVEIDLVQAYKWFALAAAQDDVHAPDIRVSMAKVEVSLTKEQVAEAQRLAREFKPASANRPTAGFTQFHVADTDSGLITVTARDNQSEVFADGSFVGNTPARLNLKEGIHVIEVKTPGFKTYRREIKVTAGSDLNVNVALDKL